MPTNNRPNIGATGHHGERGGRPAQHVLRDTAASDWYVWADTSGFLRVAAASVAEAAGFNWNTGGNALSFREGPDGDATFPARTYLLDNDLGPFRIGANNEGFSAGGTLRWDYNTSRMNLSSGYALQFHSFATLTAAAAGLSNSAPFLAPTGALGAPGYSFTTYPGTGIYVPAANTLGMTFNGAWRMYFNANALQLASGLSINWASSATDPSSGPDTFLFREGVAHLIQRNSTNAQKFSVANTYTSSTSFEVFSVDWQQLANTALVGMRPGSGGGSPRAMQLVAQVASGTQTYAALRLDAGSIPFIKMGILDGTGTAVSVASTGTFFNLGIVTSTATSGTFVNTAITPTYNQAAATTANTDFLINRTQTAVGSGAQLLIDAQVGGTSRWKVDNSGNVTQIGNLTLPAGGNWSFLSRSVASSPSDGVLLLQNNAGTDFGRLQFGGTTNSFPALKRSTSTLQVRLADDSAFAALAVSAIQFGGQTQASQISDGVLLFQNAAATEFTRMIFGTNNTSGVSFVKETTTIEGRLGDGTGWAGVKFKQAPTDYTGDGAITIQPGIAHISKGSAAAMTLADPAAGDEGIVLIITAETAFAHVVSNAAGSGFNGGGAASDVATFGGAIGDCIVLVAINGKWNVVSLRNVTLS